MSVCPNCNKLLAGLPADEFFTHLQNCTPSHHQKSSSSSSSSSIPQGTCPMCNIRLPLRDLEIHIDAHLAENVVRDNQQQQQQKSPCPVCNTQIPISQIEEHVNGHFDKASSSSSKGASATISANKPKLPQVTNAEDDGYDWPCPLCNVLIPYPIRDIHIQAHERRKNNNNNRSNNHTNSTKIVSGTRNGNNNNGDDDGDLREATKPCPLCNKVVKESLYQWHVEGCGVEVTVECKVCWDDIDIKDSFSFSCHHKVCRACADQMLEICIRGNKLAACPVAECRQPVTSTDVAAFYASHPDWKPHHFLRGQRYTEIELQSTLESTGAIMTCGTNGCSNQVLLDDIAKVQATSFRCNMCRNSTCTLCRCQPFHYRLSCQQAVNAKAFWLAVLRDVCGAGDKNWALDVQEKHARWVELQADEREKERTCRLCDKCKRIIHRIDGCASIVCGRDAHGGNCQNGCGAKLNWETMKPYKATMPNPPNVNAVKKELMSKGTHSALDPCVSCRQRIVGPRFLCVNCPEESNFCLKCITKFKTTVHKDHYFQVITTD